MPASPRSNQDVLSRPGPYLWAVVAASRLGAEMPQHHKPRLSDYLLLTLHEPVRFCVQLRPRHMHKLSVQQPAAVLTYASPPVCCSNRAATCTRSADFDCVSKVPSNVHSRTDKSTKKLMVCKHTQHAVQRGDVSVGCLEDLQQS